MKRFQILANKRFKWLEENQDTLFDLIRKAEGSLYKELLKYIIDLDIEASGSIKTTAKNTKTLRQIRIIVDDFNKTKNVSIVRIIIDKVKDLLRLNKSYFDSVSKGIETTIEAKARRQVMIGLGYDDAKNAIIENGYLWNLAKGSDMASQIGIMVNQAIIAKLPLKDFQKQFFDRFVNPSGLGMLERHFYQNAYNLYQKLDRSIQSTYSDELGLTYGIYFGTAISTSRNFCLQRIGRIYTKEEILKWKDLNFDGKPKLNYNPILDCGGFSCRHHISFISNELAEELIKTEGLNKYNIVSPRKKDHNKKKSIFK